MSIKQEWLNHQNQFLDLILVEVRTFEAKLRPEIGRLIAGAQPIKKTMNEKISLLTLRLGNRDRYAHRVKSDQEKAYLLADLEEIQDEFNGNASSNTPSYPRQISDFERDMREQINSGKSISPCLPDFQHVEYDQIKINRLLALFKPSAFNQLGFTMAQAVIDSKPGEYVEKAEVERLAAVIKMNACGLVTDKFEGINEIDAYTAIENLHKSAGNTEAWIPVGTSCTHAGVLDAKQTLSNDLPMFTTTDPNKIYSYTGWAVNEYIANPKPGFTPQVVSGSVNAVLRSAVMTGTSFAQFKAEYCNNKHELCKEFIKVWADGRFEALSGTNRGNDELLIINPGSYFSVISSVRIPLNPSQKAQIAPKQPPPQAPSPAP